MSADAERHWKEKTPLEILAELDFNPVAEAVKIIQTASPEDLPADKKLSASLDLARLAYPREHKLGGKLDVDHGIRDMFAELEAEGAGGLPIKP